MTYYAYILCMYIYIYIYIYIHIHIYIYIHTHRHVFRSSQDLSAWLELTSREQLMSPECSKYQRLSFAEMLVVNEQKILCSHQCSLYIIFLLVRSESCMTNRVLESYRSKMSVICNQKDSQCALRLSVATNPPMDP